MQFPQCAVYTPAIPRLHSEVWSLCYQGLWVDLNQTQITKANKILLCTVCVITSNPNLCARRSGLERAALPVSARLWMWVTIFELEHMDSKVLQFTNSSRPGWSSYSGFLLQHLTEAPTAKQHHMIQAINLHQYYMSLTCESTIAMEDLYVLCMLCTTVMLTNLFHLAIIVYLVYKFFN